VVKIVFYPPIAHKVHKVEHDMAVGSAMRVGDFIALLKGEKRFATCFERISFYSGSASDLLREAIVIINDEVAGENSWVRDGDVVKILLPLAGG